MRSMNPREASVFIDVLRRRCPAEFGKAARYIEGYVTPEEFSELSKALSDELVEAGLGPDDEPTEYGILIERLIDLVNPVC